MSKYLTDVRDALRTKGYSRQTITNYTGFTRALILWYHNTHQSWKQPDQMTNSELSAFFKYLACIRDVTSETQSRYYFGIQTVLRLVHGKDLEPIAAESKPKPKSRRIPTCLNHDEIDAFFKAVDPKYKFMFALMYGCGLRLTEVLNLRVQDVDTRALVLTVRAGKGDKDRVVPIPPKLKAAIETHIKDRVRPAYEEDLTRNIPCTLPDGVRRKYPKAGCDFAWRFLFISPKVCQDKGNPADHTLYRHHLYQTTLSTEIKKTIVRAHIDKKVSAHAFRHTFATHLLECDGNLARLQKFLGHKDLSTTQIYLHLLESSGHNIKSHFNIDL